MHPAFLLLPAQPTPLVGRAAELATIRQLLAAEGVRLLTLTGPAGVGKTRLALEAAARLADVPGLFSDGIAFVDLTPVREPALVLSSLAGAVGLLDIGSRSLLERLQEALGERQQLLVLDNFEQVLPAAAPLAELLTSCPGLTLLVTSRVPLQLRWERALRISPLPVPDLSAPLPPPDELMGIPSVALFVQRARARQANFVLSEKQAPLVAQVVAQLDGLPLALELAATRTATLALPAIARRLGDRLRLLRWEGADMPERQRSLEAAVGWSYDLLGEPERCLFRCLGVFVGRVSLGAITTVVRALANGAGEAGGEDAGRTLQQLVSLAEKSLLLPARPTNLDWQQEGGEDMADDEEAELAFGMLETVRQYAEERLAAAGELGAARRAHAHYFLALVEQAGPQLYGRDQRAWFLRLEREHDNLRAALRWLLDQEDPAEREQALRLAGALGNFWQVRGYQAEGRRWLEEALARAPMGEGADAAGAAVRTKALLAAAPFLAELGNFARARAVLREALEQAQQQQDAASVVQALNILGACAVFASEAAEAVPLLEEAADRARSAGGPNDIGLTLYYLGAAAQAQGDTAVAVARYTEALSSCEAAGHARLAGTAHLALAALVGPHGDVPVAVQHVQAGLEASATLRDRWLLSLGARAALTVVGDQGDPAERARLLGAADALRQATGAALALWEHVTADRTDPDQRARLTQGEWEAAYREGRSLHVREVAALALRLLEEVAQSHARAEPGPAVSEPRTGAAPSSPQSPLSAREQEVLRLVALGLSSKAIAQQLFLSASTVNQHLTSVFHKLGVNTRAQAVAVAAQRGLL